MSALFICFFLFSLSRNMSRYTIYVPVLLSESPCSIVTAEVISNLCKDFAVNIRKCQMVDLFFEKEKNKRSTHKKKILCLPSLEVPH